MMDMSAAYLRESLKEVIDGVFMRQIIVEISKSLKKVLVSKKFRLQSQKNLGLITFEKLKSWKVSVSKKQKKIVSKKSQSRLFPLNSLGVY